MKKIILMLGISILLIGCSSNGISYVSEDQIEEVFETPDKFTGKGIKIGGKISNVFTDDNKTIYNILVNQKDSSYIILTSDKKDSFKEDEYVLVDAKITDSSRVSKYGDIAAENIKMTKSTYIESMVPTIKYVDVNQTKSSSGIDITLVKVEFAKNQTRAYLKVVNNTDDNFNVYMTRTMFVLDNKEYEEDSDYNLEDLMLNLRLTKNETQEGIMTFEQITNYEGKTIKLIVGGLSSDYKNKFEQVEFDIVVK